MKIGYIRVSKHEQNESLQNDALQEAECEKFFRDVMTGVKFERKGLDEALAYVRPGDTLWFGSWIAWDAPSKISLRRWISSKSVESILSA